MAKDVADLTGLLQAWSRGDAEALEQLAPLVHLELRGVARRMLSRERQADGWQPTDLVQESYVRLLDWRVVRWQNRAHFFATTARMMRRVLVDAARARRAVKRGGGVDAASLEGLDVAAPELHGAEFRYTLFYGSWNGRIIFDEPMITKAVLESRETVDVTLPPAARYASEGLRAGGYRVSYNEATDRHRVALTQLAER